MQSTTIKCCCEPFENKPLEQTREHAWPKTARLQLAILLVALAPGGRVTAPPPPTYVAGTLAPACDSSTDGSTSGCSRKSPSTPEGEVRGLHGVLYGNCSEGSAPRLARLI